MVRKNRTTKKWPKTYAHRHKRRHRRRNYIKQKKMWVKKNLLEKKMWVKKIIGQKNVGQIFFWPKHLVMFNLGCIPKISFQGNLEVV